MIHLEGIDASIIKSNQFLTNDQLFCLKIVENDLFVILGSQNRPITSIVDCTPSLVESQRRLDIP